MHIIYSKNKKNFFFLLKVKIIYKYIYKYIPFSINPTALSKSLWAINTSNSSGSSLNQVISEGSNSSFIGDLADEYVEIEIRFDFLRFSASYKIWIIIKK